MILLARKNDTSSIRKVCDDNGVIRGVVGKIKDLVEAKIIVIVGKPQYSSDTWMCVPATNFDTVTGIGANRLEAIENASFGVGIKNPAN